MNKYVEYAKREFTVLGWDKGDDKMQKLICKNIIDLLEVFGKQGHSGTTAPYVVNCFKKLALFLPIAPLTGKKDEWEEVCKNTWQNKRHFSVFKEADGRAYDSGGKVFINLDDSAWNSVKSRVNIKFPYTPKIKYVYRKKIIRLFNKIKKCLTNK